MKFKSLGLCITDKCNMHCSHCITDASCFGKNTMSIEKIQYYVSMAKGYFTNICITGGEALLFPELVKQALQYIYECKLTSSLVSNCYWVKHQKSYDYIIGILNDSNLTKLAVSFDSFHNNTLFDIDELIKLMSDNNRKFSIVVQPCYLNTKQMKEQCTELEELCISYECDFDPSVIVPFGRAKNIVPISNDIFIEDMPCDVVRLPLVNYGGEYSVCCGPASGSPLFSPLIHKKTNVDTFDKVKNDLIVNALFLYGPHYLFEKLSENLKDKVVHYSKHIDNACGLCRAMCDQEEIVKYLYDELEKDKWKILCSSEQEGI